MGIESTMEVELDIFSGRPNPRWMLTAEAIGKLRADLRERATAEPQDLPGLGYRGFVVTNLGQDRSIPRRLRVYNGVVITMDQGREMYEQDVQGVEQVLIKAARKLGYGEVIERFRGGPHAP